MIGPNMKTSEAFRETLKHLWDGREETRNENVSEYICSASKIVGVDKIVKPIMEKLLDGCYSYESWVIGKMNLDYLPSSMPHERQKLQYSRKLWLEHLIQHYESIGD